jgi:hypothetical protein
LSHTLTFITFFPIFLFLQHCVGVSEHVLNANCKALNVSTTLLLRLIASHDREYSFDALLSACAAAPISNIVNGGGGGGHGGHGGVGVSAGGGGSGGGGVGVGVDSGSERAHTVLHLFRAMLAGGVSQNVGGDGDCGVGGGSFIGGGIGGGGGGVGVSIDSAMTSLGFLRLPRIIKNHKNIDGKSVRPPPYRYMRLSLSHSNNGYGNNEGNDGGDDGGGGGGGDDDGIFFWTPSAAAAAAAAAAANRVGHLVGSIPCFTLQFALSPVAARPLMVLPDKHSTLTLTIPNKHSTLTL